MTRFRFFWHLGHFGYHRNHRISLSEPFFNEWTRLVFAGNRDHANVTLNILMPQGGSIQNAVNAGWAHPLSSEKR